MEENQRTEENQLVDQAVEWLREHLPPTWEISRTTRASQERADAEPSQVDGEINLRGPSGSFATIAVEARRSLDPRGVEELLPRLTRLLLKIAGNVPVLVVAPWLSPRTQELLRRENVNFLDLTGNALIALDNPGLYVRSAGATRNPNRTRASRPRLRGPKAARLMRLLIDVKPPYGVSEIAASTHLAPGYVSRLLDTLDREALIERVPRGPVESVDIRGLLLRWAESYDVFKANEARTFVAGNGAAAALDRVAVSDIRPRSAVTGSFAAVRFAPVSAPALLLLYCQNVEDAVSTLGLLPADEGGNVALLRPFDPVVWERTRLGEPVQLVAPSQVVVDCLTGTGRMPAEGEAVLDWMASNEPEWRIPSLRELKPQAVWE